MRKSTLFVISLLAYTIIPASATTVSLTADRENLTLGETIKFHLDIDPSEPVGGQFFIQREVEPRKYRLVKVILDKSSCPSCGGPPLSWHLSSDYNYKPPGTGNYWAGASFGEARDDIYFTVLPETTTTTITTTTTTTTTEPTTTTSTATTTTTTSTLDEGETPADSSMLQSPFLFITATISLVVSIIVVSHLRSHLRARPK